MAQYQTNTGVQPQKPGMVDKVKAKAEGMVEKITGHTHPASTGVASTGTDPNYAQQQQTGGGYGGQQGQGYGGQQGQGYGGQQGQGYGGQQGQGYDQGNQQPGGANPYVEHLQDQQQTGYGRHTDQPAGGNTGYGQQNPSMMDKVKGLISPGHQSDTVGAGHGTGTGYHNTGNAAGQGASTAPSTMDKIKNMIPGHHKTTGAGTGYDN